MQIFWPRESKLGVQRLSGQSSERNSEKKIKKIALLRKEPQMAGTIQPANRRANGLKETGMNKLKEKSLCLWRLHFTQRGIKNIMTYTV